MPKASNCGVMTLGACSLKVIMPQFVVLRGNIPLQHNSQTTLPRRGSSQEFTEHKNNREASRDGSLRSRNKFCKLLTQT